MSNLNVGKPTVSPDASAHKKGNSTGSYEKMGGHFADGRSSSKRSTGINPKGAEPIDPRMPNLSPA
jgi:hypothetical protein